MENSRPHRGWISRIGLLAASAALTFAVVTAPPAQAQTFTVLYTFTGSSDGKNPFGGVVQDAIGNLYGTTEFGGSSGSGVVFELDNSGTETVLYSFTGGSDGAYPFSTLLRDATGNLYGTALKGGTFSDGVVFKVDSGGKETVLYNFKGGMTDGCYPSGGLIQDSSGSLYGTTSACGSYGYGTVFKVSRKGKETVLHSFAGGATDGADPQYTSLLVDKRGSLYGVTVYGGSSGQGVVYRLAKSGKLTVLHSFLGGSTDGCNPYGAVAMDTAGRLYGTTEFCGSSSSGTVWKVSKKGTEIILHSFAGSPSDGANPLAGVVLDPKGDLYGVTALGGASGDGTVYRLSKTGTHLLHSFSLTNGAVPIGGLLRDTKGGLYGTAYAGGSDLFGTVWRLTP